MPPLVYCKMAGPKYVAAQSRNKKYGKQLENRKTYTPNHPRTYISPISIPKGVGGGEAAAHPFWEFISDLYKRVGEFVCRCWGLLFCCVIYRFEIAPQHSSGQPFCNMSIEAVEMIVKYTQNLVCCRLAKAGVVNHCLIYAEGGRQCIVPAGS